MGDDIGLVKLDRAAPYTETIRPICLPCSLANTNFEKKELTVSGWGHTTEDGSMSDVMRAVNLPFLSNPKCKETYGAYIRDTSMCAGVGGKDSCQGHSGGPGVFK